MILAEITIGQVTYYLSSEGYQGEQYHYPFIKTLPRLEIGSIGKGGLIGVKLGDITITNDPHNQDHPFGGTRYTDLLTNNDLYSVKIIWSKTKEVLHDGAMSLSALTQEELTFNLTDQAYEKYLKHYSITNQWFYVEEVLNQTPVTLTIPGHEFVVGQVIVFDLMQAAGSELNYSKTADNYYVVSSVSGNDVGIKDKNNLDVSPANVTTGTVTFDNGSSDGIPKNRVGIPAYVPFTHGKVFHKTPVIRRHDTEVANPNLKIASAGNPIEVYEDGVLIGTSDPTSSEYFNRQPTADVIYLNSQMAEGDLSISGQSDNGSTLSELFQYFANQLILGFNNDKA